MDKKKYTPIKDRVTNKPIFLGDYVKNEKGYCGVLAWDNYYNKYFIRSEFNGNLHSISYTKIKKIKKNIHDTTKVECRKKTKT